MKWKIYPKALKNTEVSLVGNFFQIEDTAMKNIQIKLQRKIICKNNSAKLTLGCIKYFNACNFKDSEGSAVGEQIIKEIMTKNFPNLLKTVKP